MWNIHSIPRRQWHQAVIGSLTFHYISNNQFHWPMEKTYLMRSWESKTSNIHVGCLFYWRHLLISLLINISERERDLLLHFSTSLIRAGQGKTPSNYLFALLHIETITTTSPGRAPRATGNIWERLVSKSRGGIQTLIYCRWQIKLFLNPPSIS